jgi:hypothetical protein
MPKQFKGAINLDMPVRLHVDGQVVAEGEFRTIASRYSLCGEGLCVGYDGYVDLERELHAAVARD